MSKNTKNAVKDKAEEAKAKAEAEAKAKAEAEAKAKAEAEAKAKAEAEVKAKAEEEAKNKDPDFVVVFCALPSGLAFHLGKKLVEIKGSNASLIKGKYGITHLKKDTWDEVKKIYGSMEVFKNEIIFTECSVKKGSAKAEELNSLKTGFEGIDPDKPAIQGIKPA